MPPNGSCKRSCRLLRVNQVAANDYIKRPPCKIICLLGGRTRHGIVPIEGDARELGGSISVPLIEGNVGQKVVEKTGTSPAFRV